MWSQRLALLVALDQQPAHPDQVAEVFSRAWCPLSSRPAPCCPTWSEGQTRVWAPDVRAGPSSEASGRAVRPFETCSLTGCPGEE